MKLKIVIASTRPGRIGPTIALWFDDQFRHNPDLLVDHVDAGLPLLDEPPHPAEDRYLHAHTRNWSAVVDDTDALVFVMPEYNVGCNAALKNALDYLYTEWNLKPVGLVSYGMTSAGLRAVKMLKPVLTSLRTIPVYEAVSIPLRIYLDDDGNLHPDAYPTAAARRLIDDLLPPAEALAPLDPRVAMLATGS